MRKWLQSSQKQLEKKRIKSDHMRMRMRPVKLKLSQAHNLTKKLIELLKNQNRKSYRECSWKL